MLEFKYGMHDLFTLIRRQIMSVKRCPLGPDYDGAECDPKDCGQCQNDAATESHYGDELPNYDYYAEMPPY